MLLLRSVLDYCVQDTITPALSEQEAEQAAATPGRPGCLVTKLTRLVQSSRQLFPSQAEQRLVKEPVAKLDMNQNNQR